MITLINKTDENATKFTAVKDVTITLRSDSTLPDVLAAFELFLRASDYHFDGSLEIVHNYAYKPQAFVPEDEEEETL